MNQPHSPLPPIAESSVHFTCGTRSPHFVDTRDVHRSGGSVTWLSTSMTPMRPPRVDASAAVASATAGPFIPGSAIGPRAGRREPPEGNEPHGVGVAGVLEG